MKKNEEVSQTGKAPNRYGWFKGVYVPSLLTIFGVILYLRMGWMYYQTGLWGSLIIITLSSLITLFTSLSIASTATNMKVGGGGAYYMISRSFGVETGAAIGIPLYLAQALGIAFYVTGFVESVHTLAPFIPQLPLSLVCLAGLGYLSYASTDLALKAQGLILILIILSLVSFALGISKAVPSAVEGAISVAKLPFWTVFAIFFPAVTGITAGLSMSGDLKKPSRDLPIGTIAAVLTGYVVYMAVPVLFSRAKLPLSELAENPLLMQSIALIPLLVILGLWGSILSSALGSLLGAPRTLQALAKDRILFSFLGKGEDDSPKRATVVSIIIAGFALFLGDLNAIAVILSMFFLTTYGFLNLAAGLESIMGNPSWRPTFKVPFAISFLGAFGCIAAMLMINAGATFIAMACVFCIYVFTKQRKLGNHWSDIRRGLLVTLARKIIYRLDLSTPDARSWRPNLLVLSGSPKSRWHLVEMGHALTRDKSLLTLAAILEESSVDPKRVFEMERSLKDFLNKKGIQSLFEVHRSPGIWSGIYNFVQGYGLGPIRPNTILLGNTEKPENYKDYAKLIASCHSHSKNVILVKKAPGLKEETEPSHFHDFIFPSRIDVWWGRERQNASLMLALAYLIQQNNLHKQTSIYLKTTIQKEEEREQAEMVLENFISQGRLNIKPEVHLMKGGQSVFELIKENSSHTDLIFLGMRPPSEEEDDQDYANYYQSLLLQTKSLPKTCYVLASENINFKEIFS